MNSDTVTSLIKALIMSLGGGLTANGWVTHDELSGIAGIVISIVALAWQIYTRWNTRQVPEVVAERVDVPTVSSLTGKTIPGPDYTG